MGEEAFTAAVRAAVQDWGGKRAWGPISRRVFAALTDTEGVVVSSRHGLLRRCADELGDLQRARAQLRAVEADMVAVLDELGLSRLGRIPALTAVGAAAILAEAAARTAMTALPRWSSTPGCPLPIMPPAHSPGRRTSPAAQARPAADRVARGLADAPVQPGDGSQVPGDDQHRR